MKHGVWGIKQAYGHCESTKCGQMERQDIRLEGGQWPLVHVSGELGFLWVTGIQF